MDEKKNPGKLFEELVAMVAHLRSPDGCPWDRKQTYESMLPHFLEEAHEAAEELTAGDFDGFREEIGDTLFLVAFLVRIAEEENRFNICDSLVSILDKMKRRHPHVYGDQAFRTDEELKASWEESKRREKGKEARESILDGIPSSLPALLRARRIGQKAASIGFDWPELEPVVEKLDEEVEELRSVLEGHDKKAIENEIGDLLFSVVNVARFLDIDPEVALNRCVSKFRKRFHEIEKKIDVSSPPSLEVMEQYWREAKKLES